MRGLPGEIARRPECWWRSTPWPGDGPRERLAPMAEQSKRTRVVPGAGETAAGELVSSRSLTHPGAPGQDGSRRRCCGADPSTACAWRGSGFHCRGRDWGGCGETFGGLSGFDAHQRGGRCLDPASVGLVLDEGGIWRAPAPVFGADDPRPGWRPKPTSPAEGVNEGGLQGAEKVSARSLRYSAAVGRG